MMNFFRAKSGKSMEAKCTIVLPPEIHRYFVQDQSRFQTDELVDGESSFQIWKGRDTLNGQPVIIRRAKKEKPSRNTAGIFLRTVKITDRVNNPFIVKLLALVETPMTIVFEFFKDKLLNVITQKKPTCTGSQLTTIALGIACAMQSIHKHGYIVRDLSPNGVYLTDDLDPKVACFDHAHHESEDSPQRKSKPTVYDSPEVLQDQKYSAKTDVYSFGMILLFMATRKHPMQKKTEEQIKSEICAGKRPKIPMKVPSGLSSMIRKCWDEDSTRRPDWEWIISEFLYGNTSFSGTKKDQIEVFSRRILEAQNEPVKDELTYEFIPPAPPPEQPPVDENEREEPKEETEVQRPRRRTSSSDEYNSISPIKKRKEEFVLATYGRDRKRTFMLDEKGPYKKRRYSSETSDTPKRRKLVLDETKSYRTPKSSRKRIILDESYHTPKMRARLSDDSDDSDHRSRRVLTKSVYVDINAIADSPNRIFADELSKARSGLKPDQYNQFFDAIDGYFRLRTDKTRLEMILDALSDILTSEKAIAAMAAAGIHRNLPVDDPELIDSIIPVLRSLFAARPDLFQGNFEQPMSIIINTRPSKALMLLSSYVKNFRMIENPWPILDLFLRSYKVYFKSDCAAEYIRIFSYLNWQFAGYMKARLDACRRIFLKFLVSDDASAVIETYKALAEFYDDTFEIPLERIKHDITEPQLASAVIAFLAKLSTFPADRDLIYGMINASLENADAMKALFGALSSDGVVDILMEKPKWMKYGLPTFIWTLKLATRLAKYEGVSEEFRDMKETVIMAGAIVRSGEVDAVELLPVFLRLIEFQNFEGLEEFFVDLRHEMLQSDDAVPYVYLLANLASLGYAKGYKSFISILAKCLKLQGELAHAALHALANLAKYKKCRSELERMDVFRIAKKHCTSERDKKYLDRLLE